MKNSSIPTDKTVLISIYSKTQKENLSDEELSTIIKKSIDKTF